MLNKAQIIGNLGADPKMATANGSQTRIAAFSVATTEKGYTLQNGTQVPDKTEWHNVVCFGKVAENVERFLKKGSKVYVEGKLKTRTYDKQVGQYTVKCSVTEIHVENIEYLDSKPQQQ